jgi:hypothetical protein
MFSPVSSPLPAQDAGAVEHPVTPERAVLLASLLAGVASRLASTMSAEVAAGRLAELLVPALGDWCVVTLVDDDESRTSHRHLRDLASWHGDAGLRPVVRAYAAQRLAALSEHSFLAHSLNTGELVAVREDATRALKRVLAPGSTHDLLDRLAPETLAVIPLRRDGRTIGALSLFGDAGRDPLTPVEIDTLQRVTDAAALALDNARRFRRQRDVAETLQRVLLTAPVEPDHVQVVVRYRPAGEAARVGGDWYDAFLQPDGATVLVIGDVAGHDIEAAAVMSQLRSMLRAIAVVTEEGPAAILSRLDKAMRTLRISTMATVVVARLEQNPEELAAGVTRLRWSNAGHLPPMVVHPDGSVAALAPAGPGALLGVRPDSERVDHVVTLDRGSTVLLYTDGLVESRTRTLRDGLLELRGALERRGRDDLDALADTLVAELPAGPGEDDVAVLAARLHPQDRPRPDAAGPAVVPPDVPEEPAITAG